MSISKKNRAPNFLRQEVKTLIELLTVRKELRDGLLGGVYPTKLDLNKGWQEVAEIVSATGDGYLRSAKEVKDKWKQLKCSAKNKKTSIKKSHSQTGGGPPDELKLTETEEDVLKLINASTISGIEDGFDSNKLESREKDISMALLEGPQFVPVVEMAPIMETEDEEGDEAEGMSAIFSPINEKETPASSRLEPSSTRRVRESRWRKKFASAKQDDNKLDEIVDSNKQAVKELIKLRECISKEFESLNANLKRMNELKQIELQIKARKQGFDLNFE